MPSVLKGNNSIISGNTTFTVRPMFGSNVPWDAGNLDPSTYASLSGATFSGPLNAPNINLSGTVTTNVLRLNGNSTVMVIGANSVTTGIEFGNVNGVATTPYIDFHSSGGNTDYDARIIASAGNTTVTGLGSLTYYAAGHAFSGSVSSNGPLNAGNTAPQYSTGITVNESAHASGSKRASIAIGSGWQILQDANGNGTKDLNVYNTIAGKTPMIFGASGDSVYFSTRPTFGINTPWDSGNFNPALYAPLASPTFTGAITISGSTNITGTNKLSFQAVNLGSKIDLWAGSYGFGMQNGTMYARTGTDFTVFAGGVHSDTQADPGAGGLLMMRMNTNQTTLTMPVIVNNGFVKVTRDDQQLILSAAANTNNAWAFNSYADGNLYLQQNNANGFVSNAAWMDRTNSLYLTNNLTVPGRITGAIISANNNAGAIGVAAGGQSVLEVRTNGSANSAAFMQFHRANYYAAYLGLDTDNQFKVGGWSMGAVAYPLWHAGNIGAPTIGQCRFVYTNGTTATLLPFNGNKIFVNGVYLTIPDAGLTVTTAGLTAGQLYYVYVYNNAGAPAIFCSTTVPYRDSTWGHMIGGLPNTLVGMILVNGDGYFYDTPQNRYVASYFNRRPRTLQGTNVSSSITTGSWVEMNGAGRLYFISWGDESIQVASVGYCAPSTYDNIYLSPFIDAISSIPTYQMSTTSQGQNSTMNSSVAFPLSQGYHYAGTAGKSGGATQVSYNWYMTGMLNM